MKTLITSTFFVLFFLNNDNLSYAQCDFTKVNSPECGYATFLLDSDGNAYSDRLDFGDNTSQSVLGLSVVNHYYSSPGNYTVKRTYRSEFGPICRSIESITIAPCCPVIQDVNIIGTYDAATTASCSSGLKPTETITSSSLVSYCYFKFRATLNVTNLSGFNYGWNFFSTTSSGNIFLCNVPNTITANGYPMYNHTTIGYPMLVQFYIESTNCPRIVFNKTVTIIQQPCNYTFQLKPDVIETEEFFFKKSKDVTVIKIYPNPAKDKIQIDIQDNETYSFDIYNTLGQSILNQKVNSESSSVDLYSLSTGVYIGVLKSKDKIIYTEKIYKN